MASDAPRAAPLGKRLGLLRDPKISFAVGALSFPLLGWLSWYLSKYAMAQAGAAANATGQAISEVATFFNTLCSCGLLPLTSLLTAANQARDPTRLLGLIGAGLTLGLAVGVLGEALLLWAAPSVLQVFESQQPLLPEAAFLSRVFNMAFACQVIDGALVGVLFGLDEHLYVLACAMPLMVVSLVLTSVFLFLVDDLAILMFAQPINCTLFMVLLGFKLRTIVLRLHHEKHAAERPTADVHAGAAASTDPSPPTTEKESTAKLLASAVEPSCTPPAVVLRDLIPSDQVWRDMLFATSGNSIRNLALSLKTFLCVVFATRLGNVPGSAFSLQQTLGRHLAGPAGFIGLGATMAAPRLLEKNNLSFFLVLLRSIRNFILLCVAVWFYMAAWSGPQGVLASVGLDGDIVPVSGTALAGTREEYLQVLTPLNHWLWAMATVFNEIAAPFDGVLMSLKLYSFLGAIYAGNLLLVLLPGLYFTQLYVEPLHNGLNGHSGHGGHNGHNGHTGSLFGYSGIMLVLLLWSATRMVGCVWGVYWLEVPRRVAILRTLEAGCTREILLKWLRNRCDCPEEEFKVEKALIREKPPGEERESFRRREDGPYASFVREHNTTIVAIDAIGQRLYAEGDKELQELVHKVIFRESS